MEKIKNEKKRLDIKCWLKNHPKMKLLTLWVLLNITYIFVGSFLFTIKKINYDIFSKGYIPILIMNVVVGIIIAVNGYYKKNIIHLFMLIIILLGGISTIFAINKNVAIFGFKKRYEGYLVILYYFSIMFLTSFIRKDYKKIIINYILGFGVIQTIYAFCQIYEVHGVYRITHITARVIFTKEGYEVPTEIWATGFITNPNFFSTFMTLCLSYSIGLFVDSKKLIKSLIYIVYIGVFTSGLLIGNAMSGVVGVAVVCIYMVIYCIKNKYFEKVITVGLVIIGVTGIITSLDKTSLIQDINITRQEVSEIADGNVEEDFGTNRIYVWSNFLKIAPKYFLHGTGIDNLYYAFDGKPLLDSKRNVVYDKAHNEYLQILLTEGLGSILVYVAMYTIILLRQLKYSFNNKEIVYILPILGYLAQAFFNISVIEVAPIFYIALGLALSQRDGSSRKVI